MKKLNEEKPRAWWVRALVWVLDRAWRPRKPPTPLVVISASAEWNVRQNALAEAARVAEAMDPPSEKKEADGVTAEWFGPGKRIAGVIRALMTEGPVLASNPLEADRVPSYYELATMYRDVWAAWAAEFKNLVQAKQERDAARAELAKEVIAGQRFPMQTQAGRSLAAALQSVRSDFVDRAVAVLNEALQASPEAVTKLFANRVLCTAELRDHPTVQVRAITDGTVTLGALGVINGILGLTSEGAGPVTAVMDQETNAITEFRRSESAKREAPGVDTDLLRDLVARVDVAEQETAAMKMRATQAEEALLRANDHSEMYREAWAALGAPDCGDLKWRAVLDEIEVVREERDEAKKGLNELTAILVQHVRDESAVETLKRLVQEREEWGDRLHTLLSMLGPRCGEAGDHEEKAEGALRRILDEREEILERLKWAEANRNPMTGPLVARLESLEAPAAAIRQALERFAPGWGEGVVETEAEREALRQEGLEAALASDAGKDFLGQLRAAVARVDQLEAKFRECGWSVSPDGALTDLRHPTPAGRTSGGRDVFVGIPTAAAPPPGLTEAADADQPVWFPVEIETSRFHQGLGQSLRLTLETAFTLTTPRKAIQRTVLELERLLSGARTKPFHLHLFDDRVLIDRHASVTPPSALTEATEERAIIMDPRVFGGRPSLRGARIAVEHVLGMLAAGVSVDGLFKAYPSLDRADVLACLRFAHQLVSGQIPLVPEWWQTAVNEERARCARIARACGRGTWAGLKPPSEVAATIASEIENPRRDDGVPRIESGTRHAHPSNQCGTGDHPGCRLLDCGCDCHPPTKWNGREHEIQAGGAA